MFKLIFGLTPGWIKNVEKNGQPAAAVILSDPQTFAKSIGNYEGKDGWVDVQARVEPAGEPPYEAKMQCKLSQVVFGMLATGMKVNVKYDPKDKSRVLLVDDVNKLLSYRIRK